MQSRQAILNKEDMYNFSLYSFTIVEAKLDTVKLGVVYRRYVGDVLPILLTNRLPSRHIAFAS